MSMLPSLRTHFGFDTFRAGQEEAIQSILNKNHTLAIMPTGAGKSLIYQFAALQMEGLTLVISPLIALMKDQVDALDRKGIPATFINSAIPAAEQARRLALLSQGKYRLVYIAPERLRSVAFLRALQDLNLSLLAVDEAHCISEWGHDFRPDYLHISEARRRLGNPLTVALTATATPKVQNDMIRLLGLPETTARIVTGFNRSNLTLEVKYTTDPEAKFRTLNELLQKVGTSSDLQGSSIIYTGTRRDSEEVAGFVRVVCKQQAEHYHAGLPAEERGRIQERFISGTTPIIVATNAFGMGIDRADVRKVIHFSVPGSLEAYYQEAGRAGRDGQPARAVLLYDPQDRALQEFFIQNSVVSSDELQLLYRVPGAINDQVWLTIEDFQRRTELHPVKIKVGLAELERVGAIEHLGDDGVRMLLRKGRWNDEAIQQAAARSRDHIRHRTGQLDHMIHYAETNACRRRIVLKHFGDNGSPDAPVCCDNCETQKSLSVQGTGETSSDVAQMDIVERSALIILDTVRRLGTRMVGRKKLAQILKGSKARDIQQFHYDRNPHYGKLAALQLDHLESMIQELTSLGYLKVVGGEYPVVKLTPRGESAIQQKASIPLKLPNGLSKHKIEKKKAQIQAGGTVEYTAQLINEGLTAEQIVRRRGLTLMTIYGHCAALIEAGKLDVNKVIEKGVQEQIRAAIRQIGSTRFLSPIKSLLPDAISYEMIRCVVAAQPSAPDMPEIPSSHDPRSTIQHMVELGECGSSAGLPELIAGLKNEDGNVRRLAASALGKIHDAQAVQPLLDLLANEQKPQVRQYAIKALGNIRDSRSLAMLTEIAEDEKEMYYVRDSASHAIQQISGQVHRSTEAAGTPDPSADPVSSYLSASHPRPLKGNWHAGFALDFHSSYKGSDWNRSGIGNLVYRLKYECDASVLPGLIQAAHQLLAAHSEMTEFDIIVPVPSSAPRDFSPVHEFCTALAKSLGTPTQNILAKTRQTQPQKEMHTLPQKRDNVAGAFSVKDDITGKRILLVDDLYDSGATIEEISRLLRRCQAARVNVLTLTRTIHSDT